MSLLSFRNGVVLPRGAGQIRQHCPGAPEGTLQCIRAARGQLLWLWDSGGAAGEEGVATFVLICSLAT